MQPAKLSQLCSLVLFWEFCFQSLLPNLQFHHLHLVCMIPTHFHQNYHQNYYNHHNYYHNYLKFVLFELLLAFQCQILERAKFHLPQNHHLNHLLQNHLNFEFHISVLKLFLMDILTWESPVRLNLPVPHHLNHREEQFLMDIENLRLHFPYNLLQHKDHFHYNCDFFHYSDFLDLYQNN